MSELGLKAFTSRPRGMWILFIVGVGVYGLLVLTEALGIGGARSRTIPWSWWWLQILVFSGISLGAANRHQGLSLPFSFTMPGYRESLRRRSFARAVRWGVIVSLGLFSQAWIWRQLHSGLPSDVRDPSCMAGPSVLAISVGMAGSFFAGMAGCLLWINRAFIRFRQEWHMILIAGLGVAAVTIAWGDRPGYSCVACSALILPGVLICRFFWLCLGNTERAKNGHRMVILHAVERAGWLDLKVATSPSAEQFFVKRMQMAGCSAGARFVWGWLYCVVGRALPWWRWIVVLLSVAVLALGYLNRFHVYLAFVMLGMFTAGNVWFLTSKMLSATGRRERWRLTIFSAVLTTFLLGTVSAAAAVLSWFFATIIPPISFGTHSLQYRGFSMIAVLAACLPVPWYPLVVLIMALVMMGLHAGVPILIVVMFFVMKGVHSLHMGPAIVPILFAFGWVLFPLITWATYRRWDLDR